MIIGIFFAAALGLYFGIPLLPVLVLSALLQGGIAFVITKNNAAIRVTIPVVIAALGEFLLVPMLTKQVDLISLPFPLEWFTFAAYAIAGIGLVGSTVIGLMGGPGGGTKSAQV